MPGNTQHADNKDVPLRGLKSRFWPRQDTLHAIYAAEWAPGAPWLVSLEDETRGCELPIDVA